MDGAVVYALLVSTLTVLVSCNHDCFIGTEYDPRSGKPPRWFLPYKDPCKCTTIRLGGMNIPASSYLQGAPYYLDGLFLSDDPEEIRTFLGCPTEEEPPADYPTTKKQSAKKPTTEGPATEDPNIEEPTTEEPTTEETTTADSTTEKPTAEEPTIEEPTTEESTTEEPTTEEPTTEEPTTEEPTTEEPTTEEPTTEEPTTQEPTIEEPTTEESTTEEPTTEEPTTEEPTTEEPTTEEPTTEELTTEEPTTEEPTTEEPTTEEPTTEKPTTEEPTTEEPTTEEPSTEEPTTEEPTTEEPTTEDAIVGAPTIECFNPAALGLEDHTIPDELMNASSAKRGHPASDARLNKPGIYWCPETLEGSWLEVDLVESTVVTGVVTQGDKTKRAKRYKVSYKMEGSSEYTYVTDASGAPQVFDGNLDDAVTPITNTFHQSIVTTAVRIEPTAWHVEPMMRLELLGCRQ